MEQVATRLQNGESEIETVLSHVDLPKLSKQGYVEWNRDTGAISAGPNFEEVEQILDIFEANAEKMAFEWP